MKWIYLIKCVSAHIPPKTCPKTKLISVVKKVEIN